MGIELTELEPLVRRALDEDVGSGDLTTQATVPAGRAGAGPDHAEAAGRALRARRRAAGLRAARPRCALRGARRGGRVARRRAGARHRGPGGRDAERRAHRAEPPAAPERGGDADRALRRGGARHRRTRPRHAQDDAGPARCSRRPRCAAGGGANHRVGLFDAILIKENHAAMAGGVGAAVRARASRLAGRAARGRVPRPDGGRRGARRRRAAAAARQHGPGRAARAVVDRVAGRAELEASGGIDLETVRDDRGDRA